MKFFAIAMQNYKKQGRLQPPFLGILWRFWGLFTILVLKDKGYGFQFLVCGLQLQFTKLSCFRIRKLQTKTVN